MAASAAGTGDLRSRRGADRLEPALPLPPLFDGDEAAMERFLAEVCTPDWNLSLDAGRPFAEAVAELSAAPSRASGRGSRPTIAAGWRWWRARSHPTVALLEELDARGVPLVGADQLVGRDLRAGPPRPGLRLPRPVPHRSSSRASCGWSSPTRRSTAMCWRRSARRRRLPVHRRFAEERRRRPRPRPARPPLHRRRRTARRAGRPRPARRPAEPCGAGSPASASAVAAVVLLAGGAVAWLAWASLPQVAGELAAAGPRAPGHDRARRRRHPACRGGERGRRLPRHGLPARPGPALADGVRPAGRPGPAGRGPGRGGPARSTGSCARSGLARRAERGAGRA